MTREELKSLIDGGTFIRCADPYETGMALAFLRDEMGYQLVDVAYVKSIADNPSDYIGYAGTDSRYLYPHIDAGKKYITLSSAIHGKPTIMYADLECLMHDGDFSVDAGEFSQLISDLYMSR